MTTIVLWVSDLIRSAEFYKDLFEAESYYLTDGFASATGSGNEVLLHLAPAAYRDEVSLGADNPMKPVFKVQNVELVREVAKKHNCEFRAESTQHNGRHYLDGQDPDGHVIQVCY